jgi:hypothetical protein
MTICAAMMNDPMCMCCPMMDVCSVESGTIWITKDVIARSNCNGGFADGLEEVHE